MTPREERELRERIDKLEKALESKHRTVTTELLPRLKSEVTLERKGDNEAIGVAFDRMVHFVNDLAENVSDIKSGVAEIVQRGQLEVKDPKGGTSIVPALHVNTAATLRTENKTDALAVSADQLEKGQARALAWWRHPFIAVLITAVVTALLNRFVPADALDTKPASPPAAQHTPPPLTP